MTAKKESLYGFEATGTAYKRLQILTSFNDT